MSDFYDRLAPFYHLIFPDWDASIARQARALDAVIRARLGDGPRHVLDVSCGIGTQALGMAALGHHVTASDLSPGAVARAREEAARRGLTIPFSVADMRAAHEHHGGGWDVVLCADNSLPHLLSDDEILAALRQFHACTRPGGLCLVSVRDYAAMPRSDEVQPYAVREEDGVRYVILQHRAWRRDRYEMTFYIIEDRGADTVLTHALRSRYYAVTIGRLLELMRAAGFATAERLDGAFYQPLLVATRTAPADGGAG
ncbi:MAG TPA: class I SAM-dependent methyltransferase [Longimicrobium sp.]|nr:class I SAM-dependent methyltransferase [Longimicrobium sp.]